MSGENEPIRANRLSNREVMLSAAGLYNINMPSTSGGGGYNDYYTYGNRLSSVSSNEITSDQSKCEQSSNDVATASSSSVPANRVNNSTSTSNADETDTNVDDDELSLSQYELDIVNKYLNEMCDSDDHAQNVVSDEENQFDDGLAIKTSSNDDGNKSMMITKQNDNLVIVDQCNVVKSQSPSQSQSTVSMQNASTSSTSTSSSLSSSSVQPTLLAVSNANATDDMQYTQTSRQSGFDQSNAIINQIMQNNISSATHSHIDTHNDVNNNNISLSSIANNNQSTAASEAATTPPPTHGQRQCTNDSRRPCNNNSSNNNNRRTNPNSSSYNNRISANLPIVVGITSCIWGLFFYAVKSFYSDLT